MTQPIKITLYRWAGRWGPFKGLSRGATASSVYTRCRPAPAARHERRPRYNG